MNAWLKLALAAAGLAIDEWRESRARRKAQQAHTQNPRSSVFVTCVACGARVRADALSMAEHRHVDGA